MVPILCYHRVCPKSDFGAFPSLCVTPGQFKAEMKLLSRMGYSPMTVQHLLAALRGDKTLPPKPVLLTFDDGYEDNYRHAFPVLKEFGFPAVIFLVTGQIGKVNAWDKGSVPLLNERQIEEMHLAGIVFGSHTAGHIDMSKENHAVIAEELDASRKKIEQLTSRTDVPFCYPYSRLTPGAKSLVKDSGYACAFAGDGGPSDQAADPFELMRIQVFPSTSLFGFWKKIQPWYPRWIRFQRRLKKK